MIEFIPLAGFIASVVIFLFGKKLIYSGSLLGPVINIISIIKLTELYFKGFEKEYIFYNWIPIGKRTIDFGFLFDSLSILMGIVVLIVSTLVQIYSIGYQHGKERFSTYFAYINLFTSSMLLITFANSFIVMFIGWELVGLCSYLLIGFEYKRKEANDAAIKAFITTKFADL
ncbi:MAG: NADH-quinone oxidoreductase subunit L, partial [bacterium]|nr:NADH-quinone oxidoreductase subunit L [bacterium]